MHHYQDLITLFNQCFSAYRTQLVKGNDEPLYLPADEAVPYHRIYFARGYFSSALHECAHWFIAGPHRRQQVDYGYWYEPDGRNPLQQALFQSVEVKPQALEWVLSRAAGFRFRLSSDNLNGNEGDMQAFQQAVYQQVMTYCEQGLPQRATQFRDALCRFYDTPLLLKNQQFDVLSLGLSSQGMAT